MWVPTLLLISPTSPLPTGLVFSAFMLSMTLGGTLSSAVLSIVGGPEVLCAVVYGVAALCRFLHIDFDCVINSF